MFIKNKYYNWYLSICNNAIEQNRKKTKNSYYENHHIIPRSLGGGNEKTNLVLLTGKEHFLCHWLLTKCTSGRNKIKMMHALSFFTSKNISSKQYEISCKNNSMSKQGKHNPMYNAKPWNKGKKGEYLSEEKRQKVKDGHRKWIESGGINQSYKDKISLALKGKAKPEDFGKKISNSISGKNHWAFKGYYCTPFGKFPNSTAINNIIPNQLIRRWCKNPDRKITKNCYSQVPYLQELGKDIIGKTFFDIGFYYETLLDTS